MLARQPFPVAEKLDPGAGHQQVQRPRRTAPRDPHLRCLMPAAQSREVRNGPVKAIHRQDARHHSCLLTKRQGEQGLHRHTELDRVRPENRRRTAFWSSLPLNTCVAHCDQPSAQVTSYPCPAGSAKIRAAAERHCRTCSLSCSTGQDQLGLSQTMNPADGFGKGRSKQRRSD